VIREARAEEIPVLADVERAAGEAFRALGMAEIADDEPPSAEVLRGYLERGNAWVWCDEDEPLAYALLDTVDGRTHVEQVSVHPRGAGRGLGRVLVGAAVDRARARGEDGVTLTTFADVPWNRPYYERLGFVVLPEAVQGPELRRVREHEMAIGLDRWPRVAMLRRVTG
jgi:ribosomal protein S18 acetylase RimI-like enzyme